MTTIQKSPDGKGIDIELRGADIDAHLVDAVRTSFQRSGKPWVEGIEAQVATLIAAQAAKTNIHVPFSPERIVDGARKAPPSIREQIEARFQTGQTAPRRAELRKAVAREKQAIDASRSTPLSAPASAGVRASRLKVGTKAATQTYSDVATLLGKAGVPNASVFARGVIPPKQAQQALDTLLARAPTMREFGPRMVAVALLSEAAASTAPVSAARWSETIKRYGSLVVVRPDGYLSAVVSGEAISWRGEPHHESFALKAGGLSVGEPLVVRFGVLHAITATGEPGDIVGELAAEHNLADRALDGVENAIAAGVHGVAKLVTEPASVIRDVAQLPSAIASLIRHAPAYAEHFASLPTGDQVEAASELATNLVSLGLAAHQGARFIGNLSTGVPVVRLSSAGELAVAVQAAGTDTRLLTAGPGVLGGIYVLESSMPDPKAVDRARAAAAEHYGSENRKDVTNKKARIRANPGEEAWAGREAPRVDIREYEGPGLGHAIEKHVGRTKEQLQQRLRDEPDIDAASTFATTKEAQDLVQLALNKNAAKVTRWAADSPTHTLLLKVDFDGGLVLRRHGDLFETGHAAHVVLKGTGSGGWYVLTAYPL